MQNHIYSQVVLSNRQTVHLLRQLLQLRLRYHSLILLFFVRTFHEDWLEILDGHFLYILPEFLDVGLFEDRLQGCIVVVVICQLIVTVIL